MGQFLLNARLLSDDESLILFGCSNGIKALKVLDIDNYFELFRAIHRADEIVLPNAFSFSQNDSEYIYIYCDIPIGSRYFYDKSNRYYSSGKETRNTVCNFPVQYAQSEITAFCYPFIEKWMNSVDKSLIPNMTNSSDYFAFAATSKAGMLDALLSGMVLTSFKQKIYSAVSFASLKAQIEINNNGNLTSSHSNYSHEMLLDEYCYVATLLPKEISQEIGLRFEEEEITQFDFTAFKQKIAQKTKWYSSISSLTSWQISAEDSGVNIVIGPHYFRLNGLVDKHDNFFLFTDKSTSITKQYIGGYTNSANALSGSFSSFFSFFVEPDKNKKSQTQEDQNQSSSYYRTVESFRRISELGNPENDRYGKSKASANFIFINKDKLASFEHMSCGLPEYFSLDDDFLTSVSECFDEVRLSQKEGKSTWDAIKAQFSLKTDHALSTQETVNPRYETISNKDNKLFLLVKTSKTRETLRKAAISRKITSSMGSLVSFALRIFAIDDLTTGLEDPKEKNLTFGVTSKATFENDISSPFKLKENRDKYLKLLKETDALSKLEEFVSSLYKTTNLSVSDPFTELIKPDYSIAYRGYNDRFTILSTTKKDERAFSYLWADIKQAACSALYSPSSNMINFSSLGSGIYKFIDTWTLSPERKAEFNVGGYRGGSNLSGRTAYFLYTSNFIDADKEFSTAIEQFKAKDYVYLSSSSVLASSCFNWSQDALDVFSALKKCKTFTDYNAWFIEASVGLRERITRIFGTSDPRLCLILDGYVDAFLSILATLKEKETAFLPAATPKKGRKKKSEESSADTESVELSLEEAIKQPLSTEELIHICLGAKKHDPTTDSIT